MAAGNEDGQNVSTFTEGHIPVTRPFSSSTGGLKAQRPDDVTLKRQCTATHSDQAGYSVGT